MATEQEEFYRQIQGIPRNVRAIIQVLRYLEAHQQRKLINQTKNEAQTVGEKSKDFMTLNAKAVEVSKLDEEVDIEALQHFLDEYGLQYAVEATPTGDLTVTELFTFQKDRTLVKEALQEAIASLEAEPEQVVSSLSQNIRKATEKAAELAKEKTPDVVQTLAAKFADLFKDGPSPSL